MLPKLFANPAFLSDTVAFVESLAQQWLPSPYRFCPPCSDPTVQCVRNHGSDMQLEVYDDVPCGLIEHPLPRVSTDRKGELFLDCDQLTVDKLIRHLGRCVICLQYHSHTSTCAKSGGAPTDDDCRLTMPRPEVAETKIDPDTCCIFLRRQCGSLVSHNQAVMLGMPINHAFYLMAESSRWLRDYQMWKRKRDAGKTYEPAPVLPTVQVAAALAALYALKYATKADNMAENSMEVRVAAAIQRGRERDSAGTAEQPVEAPAEAERRAKRHVRQLCNDLDGAQTRSAALCAMYGLGYGDHILSYSTVTLNFKLFQQYVQRCSETAVDVEVSCELIRDVNGNRRLVTDLTDYLSRDSNLELISPFAMTVYFRKDKKDVHYYR